MNLSDDPLELDGCSFIDLASMRFLATEETSANLQRSQKALEDCVRFWGCRGAPYTFHLRKTH